MPLTVHCRDCGVTGEATDPARVRCGACGGNAVDVAGGRELEISTVEVEDDVPVPDVPVADVVLEPVS